MAPLPGTVDLGGGPKRTTTLARDWGCGASRKDTHHPRTGCDPNSRRTHATVRSYVCRRGRSAVEGVGLEGGGGAMTRGRGYKGGGRSNIKGWGADGRRGVAMARAGRTWRRVWPSGTAPRRRRARPAYPLPPAAAAVERGEGGESGSRRCRGGDNPSRGADERAAARRPGEPSRACDPQSSCRRRNGAVGVRPRSVLNRPATMPGRARPPRPPAAGP